MYRKYYTLFLVLFISIEFLTAQTVDGVPLKEINVKYVQLIGTGRAFQANMHVTLDYGQENTSIQRRGHVILDEHGEQIVFHSMMDALNYMAAFGYELLEFHITVNSSDWHTFYYILRRSDQE